MVSFRFQSPSCARKENAPHLTALSLRQIALLSSNRCSVGFKARVRVTSDGRDGIMVAGPWWRIVLPAVEVLEVETKRLGKQSFALSVNSPKRLLCIIQGLTDPPTALSDTCPDCEEPPKRCGEIASMKGLTRLET